jgi:hypothetical protein
MSASYFLDRSLAPDDAAVAAALGRSKRYWDELEDHLRRVCGEVTPVWKCPMAKYGWSMRLLRKKRVIFYLVPFSKSFGVTFILGERAYQAVKASKTLPRGVVDIIDRAPKYVEGRGFQVPVRHKRDLAGLKELIAIKLAN